MLFLSRDEELKRLVPERRLEATIALLEACGVDTWDMLKCAEFSVFRKAVWALERALLPGMLTHYAVRKLRIEEVVRSCVAERFEQVVILGAGLDVLGMILHQDIPELCVVEIDQPETARWKWDRIRNGLPLPERVATDLETEGLESWLHLHSCFEPHRPTVFVAEGLLMYLSDEAVDRLFKSVAALAGKGSRFVFTFMERYPDGRVRFGRQSPLIDFWLTRRGEPFRWSRQRWEIEGFLERYSMRLDELWTDAEFRRAYGVSEIAEGDHLCVARC